MRRLLPLLLLLGFACLTALVAPGARAQDGAEITIGRVKYGGGGDWYNGPAALPNLIAYARRHTLLDLAPEPVDVDLAADDLARFPLLYLNGHGEVLLADAEVERLRHYLTHGGFLVVNDDYGLDETVRREMRRVFPGETFVELPASHPVYHAHFDFPDGLPKIHEHDGRPAQGFGLFHEGRLVVFYAYESDLGDGWEPAGVHDDAPERREAALQMGVNLLVFAMTQGVNS
jgi:hypothetical protein